MPSTVSAILDNIVSTLTNSDLFSSVSLGKTETATTAVPRAHVAYEGHDILLGDDNFNNLWGRLRARVFVRTRSDDPAEGLQRAADLAASAAESLMADPFRGQLCRNLPVGEATEIGPTEMAPGIRRPEVEISFGIRCHFEQEEE